MRLTQDALIFSLTWQKANIIVLRGHSRCGTLSPHEKPRSGSCTRDLISNSRRVRSEYQWTASGGITGMRSECSIDLMHCNYRFG
jgi:hypothetical protein